MTRAIPTLKPCPDCGLNIQSGKGPHRLAFHECRARSDIDDALVNPGTLTPERVEQLLLARLLLDVSNGRVSTTDALKELSGLARAKAPSRGPGAPRKEKAKDDQAESKRDLLKFLQG